jgi:DNA helicase-2/ATP-dependent DNA helicase PcrA
MSEFIEAYTPAEVAAFITRVDPKFHKPSKPQSKIISMIENPLEPAVVIAGAGSGKTETMAARVVYLVANNVVQPHQVLGLTFTRKAAGELNIRTRKRLKQLSEGMKEAGVPVHFENFDTSVTTYHSYAGRILSEHAIRLGIDADSSPMGEAALWMLANRIVQNWDAPGFTYESAPNTVVEDLMGLTSQALEHQVSGEQITAEDQKLIDKLATMGGSLNGGVRTAERTSRQRIALVEMMNHFIKERRTSGELSFDDQIALAATIAEKFPDVGVIERTKYPVILLDEYQDTSHSQVRLLSTLFSGGHPVTAVGDPCQSIYTWRGAAAGTIGAFNSYFAKGPGAHGPTQFNLLETFRNDKAILDAANLISAEVREDNRKIIVPPLTAREDAGPGNLVCGIFENLEAEAQAIVEYFLPLWGAHGVKTSDLSFAVLVRKKSQIPVIQSALTAAGIRSEVLGLGGLIHVPEVADIVALLKVIDSPDAGGALMRHLTGPRINLGPRDIAALGRFSSSHAKIDLIDNQSIVKNILAGNQLTAEGDDQFAGSLIDALDEIEKANRSTFSPAGYARLSQFSADLRRLRSRASGPITDLILEIERYLNLDSEVALREEGIHGRRHLDRFLDEANKFSRSGGSLHAFLSWLDVASKAESGLKAGAPDVDKSVVQILTIHMSKGAEWDVVAIPGLTDGTFPSDSSRSPENWTTNERFIPFALRRDSDVVPQLSFGLADTNKAAADALKAYGEECVKYRRGEEIRLGYVAVTRAKSHLFASASHWGRGKKPLRASSLYRKIEEIALVQGRVIDELEAPDDKDRNPRADDENSAIWPRDPLGDRRSTFDAQVEKVRGAKVLDLEKLESSDAVLQSWIEDARAIIAEVAESRRTSNEIPRPVRMSPSSIIAMKRNPSEFARNIRRPMPRARDEYSSRGTAFHLWIEHHLKGSAIYDEEDFDLLQPIEEDRSLEDLKSAWLKSEWADRSIRPEEVEVPFETVIAGTLVRGRIDAVYRTDSGFEVIDWKTGSKELDEDAAIQLAIYRLAWAKLAGVPVEAVTAAFHYVPTGVTDRRNSLLSEDELNTLLQ